MIGVRMGDDHEFDPAPLDVKPAEGVQDFIVFPGIASVHNNDAPGGFDGEHVRDQKLDFVDLGRRARDPVSRQVWGAADCQQESHEHPRSEASRPVVPLEEMLS